MPADAMLHGELTRRANAILADQPPTGPDERAKEKLDKLMPPGWRWEAVLVEGEAPTAVIQAPNVL